MRGSAWFVTLAVCFGSASAWAQAANFARKGSFALSAERVAGFVHSEQSLEDLDGSVDNFNFLANPSGASTGYSAARLAFDYFVTEGFSVGGAVTYASSSTDNDVDLGESESHAFLIAPRLGYAIMFNRAFGIWPRGGITYVTGEENDVDIDLLAFTLEAPLVIAPVPHGAILLGPTLDLGLSGSAEDADFKVTDIGVQAGVGVSF